MNKIIQFLRLSRLVLLVILLLFAVVAKIARAETAVLYKGSYGSSECKAFSSPDPQAVFNVCFPGAERQGWGLHKHPTREYYYVVGPNANTQYQSIVGVLKTCDAKELTHNGSGAFYDGENSEYLKPFFWLQSPSGIDAKDWYSDRFTSCENNCIVRNTRSEFHPKSVTEADGTSWSAFRKRQTGEVCVVEKQKPDVIPKPPAPDNSDGTGNGQGGTGSDSGNGQDQGSSGSNGSGSESGTGSDNQGSGNSNDSGSSSGGSGGGTSGGGVNGSGGQIKPGGGSTGGGQSGGNQDQGSEGSDGDGQSGDGQNGSGSGEGGGTDSENGSGQGNVNGSQNQNQGQGQSGQNGQTGGDGDSGEAGGHYFPCPSGKGSYKKGTEPSAECLGEGNGDGEGSIGGGSCEADTPPDCKGDPIQCYIAREQWRTACAASGKSNKIEGQGNCEQLTPPECKGDETQCYIAKQQFISACEAQAQNEARNSLKEYADGKSGIISDVESSSENGVKKALEDNGGKIDLNNIINRSGYGWSRSCPASATIDAGVFGTFEIDNSMLCTMAQVLGKIFAALCMLFAVRYIFA